MRNSIFLFFLVTIIQSCGPDEIECDNILDKVNGIEISGFVNQCTQGPQPLIDRYQGNILFTETIPGSCIIELTSINNTSPYNLMFELDYDCSVSEDTVFYIDLLEEGEDRGTISRDLFVFYFDLPICGYENEFVASL